MLLAFTFLMTFLDFAEAESLWEMEKRDLVSVFEPDNRSLTIAGVGATAFFAMLEGPISDQVQHETVEHKPLGKYSVLGDYSGQMIPNALYVVGMGGYGILYDDAKSMKRAGLMLRATATSGLVSTVLKVAIREPRPNDPKSKDSFPSGHATTAFAFASVIGYEHGVWYGSAAYGLAMLVAYSRINDNRHFLHDVIGGAAIGLSYGLSIARRANIDGEGDTSVLSKVMVLPTSDLAGVAGAYRTTF